MSMQVKKSVDFTAEQIKALRDLCQGVRWASETDGKKSFYVSKPEEKLAEDLSKLLNGCDSLYVSLRATESE